MEKKVITEEQFRGVCKQALPHLKELIENLREIGFDGMTSITVTGDGYIALDAYDSGWKCGWTWLRKSVQIAEQKILSNGVFLEMAIRRFALNADSL